MTFPHFLPIAEAQVQTLSWMSCLKYQVTFFDNFDNFDFSPFSPNCQSQGSNIVQDLFLIENFDFFDFFLQNAKGNDQNLSGVLSAVPRQLYR